MSPVLFRTPILVRPVLSVITVLSMSPVLLRTPTLVRTVLSVITFPSAGPVLCTYEAVLLP
jgi:hypothetical protein